jgi:uncharacterized protein (TIGR03084 family)
MAELTNDLEAETGAFTDLIAVLTPDEWQARTPAPGWTIADQVSHLAYYDNAAVRAATSPQEFAQDAAASPDDIAVRYRELPATVLLEWFTSSRRALLATFGLLEPRARLPWYGPSMSAASMVTARLMETWAHGQDIADTLDVGRQPTSRLRHVAHLGVATRGFSLASRGLPADDTPVCVELTGPGGELWTWGPAEAADRVAGPALDFCLTVTRRRHLADTRLAVIGPAATAWIAVAQAYAGPPGPGRRPGQFS